MKLQELAVANPKQQTAKVFESYFGSSVNFDSISPAQARGMLKRVRGLIAEHRCTTEFYRSEQNPSYLKLIVMEQALASRIKEMADLDEVAPQSMRRVGRAAGEVLGAGIGFALTAIPGAVLGAGVAGPAGAVGGGIASGMPGALVGTGIGRELGRQAVNFTHDAVVNAWRKASAKLGGPEATAEFVKAHAQAAHIGKNDFAFGGKKYAVTMDRAQARKAMSDLSNMQGSMRESQPGATPGAVNPQAQAGMQAAQVQQKKKQIQDAIKAKQAEIAELQKQMNNPTMMAMAEGRRARRLREASEIQQAQVVLASQDMVDQVQKMSEQVSAMQFKDLPALVDQIRNEVGVEQSTQYNADASAALSGLLQNLQGAKQQLEAALGVVTGQAPQVPGDNLAAGLPAEQPAAGQEEIADLDAAGADLDAAAAAADTGLGRERR